MNRRLMVPLLLAPVLVAGCAARSEAPKKSGTLAALRDVRPDLEEATLDVSLEQAMQSYRRFLEETPETAMTPEAMRRLADLQLEQQFGLRAGDGKPREMAAPQRAQPAAGARDEAPGPAATIGSALWETDEAFEERTLAGGGLPAGDAPTGVQGPAGAIDPQGPLEAIALYNKLLEEYPAYQHNDQVLYQMARAYDELGRTEEALATMERLIAANPNSVHIDEVQFRRGEYFFMRRKFREAEVAYGAIIGLGTASSYYELALYKLGWALYKQEFYEEALHRYMALLDYKVSVGYDFDQTHDEDNERRVADTFRVVSLSFSNLGGPEAVSEYFAGFGKRAYEDRVYTNLGEHYLAKLRYDDAAKTYRSFVALYPFHRHAPRMSMRVIEVFTQGEFPKLVLEAKQQFAAAYGLKSDYWRHFQPEESPEVVAYLKTNLKDLATHFHAQYQGITETDKPEMAAEKVAHYNEAARWYGEYLDSFPTEPDSPPINYRYADLLLENKDFGGAAKQYERTAYGYEAHPQSPAAGYAAVYAYREQLKVAGADQLAGVKHDTIASSLRFADAFPQHESAAAILGAAADDMYEMKDYGPAVAAARRLIDTYPTATADLRRSAWVVVAHGSFEQAEFAQAEDAYTQVLAATPPDDASRAALVDTLAASIYRQGELARQEQDHRAAADHFQRVRTAAPTSTIRATAEYDAGIELIALQDWKAAAGVLEAFRKAYPEHELQKEATRQLAHAYRESGLLANAADEFNRLASQVGEPALRSEALLVAGDLYQQSKAADRALEVYTQYVMEFPQPVEPALETRSKIAEIHKTARSDALYLQELAEIVRIDGEAGPQRTGRTRTLAARSALVLAEQRYRDVVAVKLTQPFEASLQEKKRRMDLTIEAMSRLVEYEIADVTAAATFYMAETYLDFSRALTASERPSDLQPGDLEDYELALEEEAFPFEEKAIDVHEKNMEMMQAGMLNPWTEQSFGRLIELVPGRYAKTEISGGFLGGLDSYAYRSPAAAAADAVQTTQLESKRGGGR